MPPVPPPPEFDLNCDLGEGEARQRTLTLLGLVDSANIAAGGHAGDEDSMRFCLTHAGRLGVRAGAHPGFPDRAGFGRAAAAPLTEAALRELLSEQVGRLSSIASLVGVPLHHVKLHGALYHAVESDAELARAYLSFLRDRFPGLVVFARSGGEVIRAAAMEPNPAIAVWPEGFLDRGYRDDGTLVPRGAPGAMLPDFATVRQRLADLAERGGLHSVTGRWIELRPRTLCVHGDSPQAIEWLEEIRRTRAHRPAASDDPTGR